MFPFRNWALVLMILLGATRSAEADPRELVARCRIYLRNFWSHPERNLAQEPLFNDGRRPARPTDSTAEIVTNRDGRGHDSVRITDSNGQVAEPARTDRLITTLLRQNLYPPHLVDVEALDGKKVLDVATGDGSFVRELRSHGIEAFGLDLALRQSQRRQPFFVEADARNTGLAPNQFDVIYSTWGPMWYRFDDPGFTLSMLREMKRILRPGGELRLSPAAITFLRNQIQEVGGLTITESGSNTGGTYVVITRDP